MVSGQDGRIPNAYWPISLLIRSMKVRYSGPFRLKQEKDNF
jgi:hypothetical protein